MTDIQTIVDRAWENVWCSTLPAPEQLAALLRLVVPIADSLSDDEQAAVIAGLRAKMKESHAVSEQPFGPEWVARKIEENERGFGRKS